MNMHVSLTFAWKGEERERQLDWQTGVGAVTQAGEAVFCEALCCCFLCELSHIKSPTCLLNWSRGKTLHQGLWNQLLFYKPVLGSNCSFLSRVRNRSSAPTTTVPSSSPAACLFPNYRCVTCTCGHLRVSASLCLSWHILWSQHRGLQGTTLPCRPSLGISISMLTGPSREHRAKGHADNCQQPALISWAWSSKLCKGGVYVHGVVY